MATPGTTITGTDGPDNLIDSTTNRGQDTLVGLGGDDTLTGYQGDVLQGGPGDDRLQGFSGNGSSHYAQASYATAGGGVRVDLRTTGPQDVGGGEGRDTLVQINNLIGSAFGDTLTGATYNGVLRGDGGDDSLTAVAYGLNTVWGGTGDDTIADSGAGQDWLYGEAGNDVITGNSSANVDGGDGDDRTVGGNQAFGGNGADTMTGTYSGGFFATRLHGGAGDDLLIGTDHDDLLYAGGGHNILQAGAGNDTLFAYDYSGGNVGFGDTVYDGGAGFDRVDFSDSALGIAPLTVNMAAGTVHSDARTYNGVFQPATDSTLISIEQVLGTPGGDTMLGGDAADRLFGGRGSDVIIGGAGDDYILGDGSNQSYTDDANVLSGGLGNDTITGGGGSDGILGDEGDDRLIANGDSTGEGDYLDGGAGNDTLTGWDGVNVRFGFVEMHGGEGDDVISAATVGESYLRGEDGADTINGAAQFDYINGNKGADIAHGNGGGDWVLGGQDNDVLYGDAGADVLNGNLGDDTVDGGAENDTVRGGQGSDILQGQAGDDWISGDLGDDTITGGAGADTFHGFAGIGVDRITDFDYAAGDRIQLDPGTAYSAAQVGADTVVTVNGGQMVLVGVQLSSLGAGWVFGP